MFQCSFGAFCLLVFTLIQIIGCAYGGILDSRSYNQQCPSLGRLMNGRIHNYGRNLGQVVTFTCDKGYILDGQSSMTCQAHSYDLLMWSNSHPSCKKDTMYCPLQTISYGTCSSKDRSVGSVRTCQCNNGYVLKGDAMALCLSGRQWSHPLPRCQAVDCQTPAKPQHGHVYVRNTTTFESWAQYACKRGYEMRGTRDVQCLSKGNWSSGPPSCIPYCTLPSNPINGQVTISHGVPSLIPVGTTITYSCIKGYIWHGTSNVRTCIGALSWYEKAPTCQEGDCGQPLSPGNGSCIARTTKHGGRRRCTCAYGFKFRDGSLLKEDLCQVIDNVAKWIQLLPSCEEIVCPDLRSTVFPNVVLQYRGNHLDDIASYRCAAGYERVIGDFERKCQRNDKWSGTLLQCTKKSCKLLTPSNHGLLRHRDISYGSRVSYSCESGYALHYGLAVRTCQFTGQWTERSPICRHVCAAEALQCLASEECISDSTGQARCVRILKSPSDYKPFSCSDCHKNADCIADSYCKCRPGYVGNREQCCSRDMGGQVTVTGANAYFRCNSGCDVPYSNVTWYKNEALFNNSQYGLANDGMILLLGNLTVADAAEYTCLFQVDGTILKRYGSLEVLDVRKTNLASSSSCSLDCGKSCARKPLVAGGVLTYAGQFPWQAMLCSPPQGQYCGGVLVSSDCIVTAAHCIVRGGNHVQDITVCLGRQCGNCSENDSQGKPQCFQPQSVAVHPQYDSGTLNNDIAVMKLGQSPLMDCSRVYPVCLPNKTRDDSYIRAHKHGIVTGWGKVNSTVSRSRCLRKGHVRLASRRICGIRHSKYPITASMICATDYNGACEGDSGGPLVVKNGEYGGRYVLAGIVSWGIGCGDVTKLGVYTNVLSHLEWIKNTCGI